MFIAERVAASFGLVFVTLVLAAALGALLTCTGGMLCFKRAERKSLRAFGDRLDYLLNTSGTASDVHTFLIVDPASPPPMKE